MNTTYLAKLAICLTIVVFSIAASNYLKNSVYRMEVELSTLKKSNQSDVETIHVLNAEWSKLNTPSRLKALVADHIALNPIKAEQIINYSALPFSYESGDSKKDIARKNIAAYAQNNRELKKMAAARR